MSQACICEKHKISVTRFVENGVSALKITGENLPDVNKTFDCGQSFRFERVENSRHNAEYSGVAFGRFVSFANEGDALYIYNSDEDDFYNIWAGYLGLSDDYDAITADILSRSDSGALKNAVEFGRGIHILKQESWEALCSFIISQNNNIPRIKKLVSALCESAGEELDTTNMLMHGASGKNYTFPSAERVLALGVDKLIGLKTGFRAKYIYDAAARVSSGEIDFTEIYNQSDLAACADELCKIKGVGPKVAACTLLFGFGKLAAFPIDVWIKRAIAKYFPGEFDAERLGSYAGIAQQYLFYYERYLGGEGV